MMDDGLWMMDDIMKICVVSEGRMGYEVGE
jgi:hypothetical protein